MAAPLDEIAETIAATVEDTRQLLTLLAEASDFTVQRDPEGAEDGDELVIVVD